MTWVTANLYCPRHQILLTCSVHSISSMTDWQGVTLLLWGPCRLELFIVVRMNGGVNITELQLLPVALIEWCCTKILMVKSVSFHIHKVMSFCVPGVSLASCSHVSNNLCLSEFAMNYSCLKTFELFKSLWQPDLNKNLLSNISSSSTISKWEHI